MGANSIRGARGYGDASAYARAPLRGRSGARSARNVQILARHAPSIPAISGHTVSNERVSGAKPTTPEAIMADSDSKHEQNKRRVPRRGGPPWPPPGADTATWTQDPGTPTPG